MLIVMVLLAVSMGVIVVVTAVLVRRPGNR